MQRLLILSEVIKPLPDQKVINKLKCRVPPCDFRQLSRFSIKRTLGCLRNSRIHLRASRPGKGLPSKIDRNSWCSCYITFWACSRSVLVSVAEWNKKRFYSSRMRYWCLRGKSLPFLSGRSSETYCQVLFCDRNESKLSGGEISHRRQSIQVGLLKIDCQSTSNDGGIIGMFKSLMGGGGGKQVNDIVTQTKSSDPPPPPPPPPPSDQYNNDRSQNRLKSFWSV